MNCDHCGHVEEWHGPAAQQEGKHCAVCQCPGFRTAITITVGELEVEGEDDDGEEVGAIYADVWFIRGTTDGIHDGEWVKHIGWADREDPETWRPLLN